MSSFKVPLADMRFCLHEVFAYTEHLSELSGPEEADQELVDAILDESARFCEQQIAPLYQSGDAEGCQIENGQVSTPTGFRQAYDLYCQAGWPALSAPTNVGGQGLAASLQTLVGEMLGTANWAFAMYPSLSKGAQFTLSAHGSDELKQRYLPKLASGAWSGTMCLTESHCGTDLGLLRTQATPAEDGSYRISGSKIFISSGEHDLTENILHIVLARLPDAPRGTRGISLFLVPKYLPTADNEPGDRNAVECGSLEHKMGIHGNATCVMNFDNAVGYLIGEPNRGLRAMFTFMNSARVGTAQQGLAHAERGFQASLAYTQERRQMRALGGAQTPGHGADPIIVHPDVRRMLMTQKVFAEGCRMMIYDVAMAVDQTLYHPDAKRRAAANERLALLTPIAKAFSTEVGFESANHALQCFGGHGYIREWGVEQNVRDARIGMIYEGTTGIQALDLLGRKIIGSNGDLLRGFISEIQDYCQSPHPPRLRRHAAVLQRWAQRWSDLTTQLTLAGMRDQQEVGAASVDYLMLSGYITLAYFWLRAAHCADQALDAEQGDPAFYRAKLTSADFYFTRILPRCEGLVACIDSGSEPMMALAADHFQF